jgi:hypothetical protein
VASRTMRPSSTEAAGGALGGRLVDEDQAVDSNQAGQAGQDGRHAQRAAIVAASEDRPAGQVCRVRGHRFPVPCRHRRRGFRVQGLHGLLAAGWSQADVAALVQPAEAGRARWS